MNINTDSVIRRSKEAGMHSWNDYAWLKKKQRTWQGLIRHRPYFVVDLFSRKMYVRELLANGYKVNMRGLCNDTALHKAVAYGRESVVDWLLTFPDIDINAKGHAGWTALYIAAGRKSDAHFRIMDKLVRAGADLDLTCDYGAAPIHSAALVSKKKLRYLLHAGANPNILNSQGHSVLYYYVSGLANKDEHIPIIKELLKAGICPHLQKRVDSTYFPPYSALHHALYNGNFVIIDLLLQAGGNIHAKLRGSLSAYEYLKQRIALDENYLKTGRLLKNREIYEEQLARCRRVLDYLIKNNYAEAT